MKVNVDAASGPDHAEEAWEGRGGGAECPGGQRQQPGGAVLHAGGAGDQVTQDTMFDPTQNLDNLFKALPYHHNEQA